MAELPLVLILSTSAPRVDLSGCIECDTVKISAGDVNYLLSVEILEVEAVDSLAFATGLVPETAAPGEENALISECQSVVIAACYLFDAMLTHGLLEVELSEIADLSRYSNLAEEKRPTHVDLTIRIKDGCVSSG